MPHDYFLQLLACAVPPYTANSTDYLCCVHRYHLPPSSVLVTLDFASLYTNISHDDARLVVEAVFTAAPDVLYLPPITTLVELLTYVLANNVFVFDGSICAATMGGDGNQIGPGRCYDILGPDQVVLSGHCPS